MLKMAVVAAMVMMSGFSAQAQSADEIVNKHIEAVGGEAAWKKINSIKMDMKVSTAQMDFDMTIAMLLGKAGMQKMSAMGQEQVMVVTPSSGWGAGGGELIDLTDEQRSALYKQMHELQYTDDLIAAKSKKYTMVMGGKEKVNGKDAYKILVTDADGDDHTYFVDGASYQIVKETQMINVEGQQMEQAINYSDFKKLPEGITMSMKQDMGDEGTITIKKIEINTIADEKMFEKPAK